MYSIYVTLVKFFISIIKHRDTDTLCIGGCFFMISLTCSTVKLETWQSVVEQHILNF